MRCVLESEVASHTMSNSTVSTFESDHLLIAVLERGRSRAGQQVSTPADIAEGARRTIKQIFGTARRTKFAATV